MQKSFLTKLLTFGALIMERQIYYHDTDAGGVVYYANYLKFLEEARTEFLEQKGLSIKQLHENHFFYAVKQCHLKYKSPARYGDVISCNATLKKITAAQMFFEQTVREKHSQRILVTAEVILVSLNKDFKPTLIADTIRNKLL